MPYTYDQRKRPQGQAKTSPAQTATPGPVSALPRAGTAGAGSADLESAMRERMTNTFGDLSAVRDWQPPAQTEAAAGPMQAKRGGSRKPKSTRPRPLPEPKGPLIPATPDPYGPDTGPLKTDDISITTAQKTMRDADVTYMLNGSAGNKDPETARKDPYAAFMEDTFAGNKNPTPREGMKDLFSRLIEKYKGPEYEENAYAKNISRPRSSDEKEDVVIDGWDLNRILPSLVSDRGRGFNMSAKDIEAMTDKMMAPHRKGMSEAEKEQANKLFDEGIRQYKGILNDDLEHMEKTYGALPTQMHPEGVIPQLGKEYHQKYHFIQDALQIAANGKYMDYSKEKDRRFRDLTRYYNDAGNQLVAYAPSATEDKMYHMDNFMNPTSIAPVNRELEASLKGPRMNGKQEKEYKKRLKSRARKGGWKNMLFGRYK